MQDRPTVDELLEAVGEYLLRDVLPATQGRVSFHARVAANVIGMVRREIALGDEQFEREWAGLDSLLGPESPPVSRHARAVALEERNRRLVDAMPGPGEAIPGGLLDHLLTVTLDKLAVTNPALAGGR